MPIGDGFAMANLEFGKLLEFVRGPVAEIQRAGRAKLERVAGGGDVVEVQFGAAIDEPLHGCGIKRRRALRVPLDRFEEWRVANERDFHRFDITGAFVAGREGGEQFKIVDDGKGRGKGADEIFFAKGVDAILHAHAGIVLAEGGGGKADVAHAAMGGGGGQTDHVEQCPAAHRHDIASGDPDDSDRPANGFPRRENRNF